MPASNRRSRSVPAILLASLAFFIAFLWLLSSFRCFALMHTGGTLVRNTQTPAGQMGAWEYTLTSRSVQTCRHGLRFARSNYLSVMQREDERAQFAEQLGWRVQFFSALSMRTFWYPWASFGDFSHWRLLGLGPVEAVGGGQSSRMFDVPYWMALAVVGLPLLALARRARRLKRRRRQGRCLNCGYQLDAVMARCPECGSER